jgi:hypothetical protein
MPLHTPERLGHALNVDDLVPLEMLDRLVAGDRHRSEEVEAGVDQIASRRPAVMPVPA